MREKEHSYSTLMKMRKEELVQRFMVMEQERQELRDDINILWGIINNQSEIIEDLHRQVDAFSGLDEDILP